MRAVINSAAGYATPRSILLESLVRSRFDRWDDVLVVIGGEAAEAPPARCPLDSLLDLGIRELGDDKWTVTSHPGVAVTCIRTKEQSFDYHGFAALHRRRPARKDAHAPPS